MATRKTASKRPGGAAPATPASVRHARELEALYAISQVLAGGAKQREKLAAVLDVLDNDLAMRRGTVSLVSPDGGELVIEVGQGLSERQRRSVRCCTRTPRSCSPTQQRCWIETRCGR